MRIAVLMFSHETVTFLKNETGIAEFTYPGSPAAGEALLAHDPRGYIGGFVAVAREYGAELVGIDSPLWPVTGSGSGWVTQEAYEHFVGRMIAELAAQGPWDGVYLSVHGAMAAHGVARPEAELARRVRAVVGKKAVLAGTFDPHGNEDAQFFAHADLAFCVKYFPHYDTRLQGERAARMMVRAIRGEYRPAQAVVKVPILTPTVQQWTGASPWMDLVQRALTWEAREPDLYVNVFFGFPWSDVVDVGMTIQAISNGDSALAQRAADDMADAAWRWRKSLVSAATIHLIGDGVRQAAAAVAGGKGPVVLADHSDRSGGATWLLRAVIDGRLARTVIATVADAGAVEALRGAKEGDAFDRAIGGLMDESAGEPVRVVGTLAGVGKGWVTVRFGAGNVLVISAFLTQIMYPSAIAAYGLDPAAFDVFAIKSRVHFRRGFDDSGFAPTILVVEPDEPFLGTVRLEALPYRNVDVTRFYPYGEPRFP